MTSINSKIGRSVLALGIFVVMLSFVRADSYQLYCIPQGQSINLGTLCNPTMGIRSGPIQICMHLLDNGKICPTILNACNNLGLACNSNGTGTNIDSQPPTIQINSPLQGSINTEKSLLLNIQVDETSAIAFIDNSNNRGKWTTICTRCLSSSRKRMFKEGFNDLLFRATDKAGNKGYKNLTFFVDTKSPQIKKVLPKNGFTSGLFRVEFVEDNPTSLILHYGNSISGMVNLNVNLSSCTAGTSGSKVCEVQTNLNSFDNEEIELWAEMTDIAGNNVVSQHNILKVDFSNPIITTLEYPVNGKLVNFHIELNEANPKEILYIDNSENNAKWKTLCSGMMSGTCDKKVPFKDGSHEVELKAVDLAGNSVSTSVNFFTDSKKPKINKIAPMSGFASGDFDVYFSEENPTSLILNYGNSVSGMRSSNVNINQDCFLDRTTYKCLKGVNLADFNGNKIEYYFVLTDVVGQSVESKHISLDVDTTFPVINSITHTLSANKATITLDISEQFFDRIIYVNEAESNPTERTFCSALIGGKCKKTITLTPGTNNVLHFQVMDKAGNSVAQIYQINL